MSGAIPEHYRYAIEEHTAFGRLWACPTCKRLIVIHVTAAMPRGAPTLTAVCLDCCELSDSFRAQSPEAAALIGRWRAANPPKEAS